MEQSEFWCRWFGNRTTKTESGLDGTVTGRQLKQSDKKKRLIITMYRKTMFEYYIFKNGASLLQSIEKLSGYYLKKNTR